MSALISVPVLVRTRQLVLDILRGSVTRAINESKLLAIGLMVPIANRTQIGSASARLDPSYFT